MLDMDVRHDMLGMITVSNILETQNVRHARCQTLRQNVTISTPNTNHFTVSNIREMGFRDVRHGARHGPCLLTMSNISAGREPGC
jgi:hypothetical protein